MLSGMTREVFTTTGLVSPGRNEERGPDANHGWLVFRKALIPTSSYKGVGNHPR